MQETVFDKNIHSYLNSDFGDSLLKVTTNYVDSLRLLDSHLKAVYGTEIKRKQVVDEYKNTTKDISTIDDIEEVTEDFIRELIKTEDEFQSKVNRLYELNNILSDLNVVIDEEKRLLLKEAVDLIGLTGEKSGILSDIIDKYSFVEKPEHFRSVTSALLMIVNEVSKLYESGMQLTFPNTKAMAMTQRKGRCFYRGENAFYKSSKAGCYRGKLWSELREPGWDYVLWKLRLYECFHFFDNFDVVKHWKLSDINYMALAQHYGLRTQLLDITTNLKTALFFACCKPNKNGLNWQPLTKADFEKVDSRKNVAVLGGDSRYAIIYYVPTSIVDCQWVTLHEDETHGIITPIGYQPFMRCSAQYGYMLATDEKYDLMKDKLFKKIKFKLTEDFCNWIYEEMDCGRAIYPNDEDIARIQDIVRIVSGMNYRTEFTRYNAENVRWDIAANIFNKPDKELDPIYFYLNLKRYGIKIKDKIELLSDKNIEKINKRYTLEKVESMMELPKCSPMIVVG